MRCRTNLLTDIFTGALLLFSEDYAAKWQRQFGEEEPKSLSSDDINLRTFGDLAKSILSYGSVSTYDSHFVSLISYCVLFLKLSHYCWFKKQFPSVARIWLVLLMALSKLSTVSLPA